MRFLLNIVILSMLLPLVGYAQGTCTTGDCVNGKGRYIFPNGDKYIGEFKDSKLNGRGVYTFSNGNVYRGQFKDNQRHGYGTFTWKSGDTYIGEYADNEREGEGTYTYADGSVMEGIWKAGEMVEEKKEEVLAENTDNNKVDPFSSGEDLSKLRGKKLPVLANEVEGQPRHALVIGNGEYGENSLKNPVNDAIAMAEELQRSGFHVTVYTNASQKDTKIAIRDFGQVLKEMGGVGLFFYAGHGLQADGRNYIVPINADIRKPQDIEFESVDLGRVLVEMDYAANDMNIVILDACRDNPYKEEFSDSRNKHNGLASINSAPYNSFIAFSTSPGAVAMDNPDAEHGLYTEQLLKNMRMDGLKIEDVFKKVRSHVRKQSEGMQIPWEISSVEDDFYFKK